MKLDMGRAWNDALAMLSTNKDMLGVLAGVFFFLPSLALSVLAPTTELEAAAGNPDTMQAALLEYITDNWVLFAAYVLASFVGTLALMALLGRTRRPTVGEAITLGLKALLPYIAASLISGIIAGVLILLIGAVAGVTGAAVGIVLGVLALGFLVFFTIRVILTAPVMMIEENFNPVSALMRSWAIVKGNTRWVFLFLLLLGLAMFVVSLISGLIFGLIAAIFSGAAAIWIEGLLGGLFGAAISILMLSVYVAIYKQLSGGSSSVDLETFE